LSLVTRLTRRKGRESCADSGFGGGVGALNATHFDVVSAAEIVEGVVRGDQNASFFGDVGKSGSGFLVGLRDLREISFRVFGELVS
jgi:hypothetical protein